jgi:hypothetical protein
MHDANGNTLNVGDKVVIPGTITQLQAAHEYCNCTVELEHPQPPNDRKVSLSSLNSKQVEKVLEPGAIEEPEEASGEKSDGA